MQVDRRNLIASLRAKGFVEVDKRDHSYFYHEIGGKRTGAYAKVSRGSSYKTYGNPLLKQLRISLRLQKTRQAFELCSCPMTGEEYEQFLKNEGVI